MKWNDIEYITFKDFSQLRGDSDNETLRYIETALEHKIIFAYYEENGILIQYDECKLPGSLAYRLFGKNSYTDANRLMFFSRELLSHERTEYSITNKKIIVNVDPSIWAGIAKERAFSALREYGFSDEVIAFILVKKLAIAKAEAGRLFYQSEIARGDERDISTYTRKIDNLLDKANKMYVFTFLG